MEKKCLECGDSFKGRIDKKFCSDLCRNAFNNKANSDTNNFVRSVNGILRKNRKILESMVPEKTASSTRQKLIDKGFNFQYYTHTLKSQKGTYYFCYEYGYLPPAEGHYYLLVKNEKDNQ